MSAIEWPPGSGRRAAYSESEAAFMHGFLEQRDNDEISTQEMVAQIDVIHDLKVELDATMIEEPVMKGTLSDPDADDLGKFMRDETGLIPATQRKAAVEAYPTTGTARRRVLDFIAMQGDYGATDEEIQYALAMNPSTVRPRRVELREGNWVVDSEGTRVTRSGRDAEVWVLSVTGRARWRQNGGEG